MQEGQGWSSVGAAAQKRPKSRTPMLFTFMICTHNRRPLVERCVRELMKLERPAGVSWEVLVVDNASHDGTSELIRQLQAEWSLAMAGDSETPELRLHHEPRLGTAYARRSGIAASRGDWVVFVDDDCLMEADWLVHASRFVTEHPHVGVIGGRNVLLWEEPPSALCEAYGESLARQDWGDEPMQVPDEGKRAFCGAGLVLKRQAVVKSGYLELGHLSGRRGRSLMAGEDTEVQLRVRNAGGTMWYCPDLKLRHWIPKERMPLRYLLPLHQGFGEVEAYLRLLGDRQPFTLANRARAVGWAWQDLMTVLRRFWLGCVKYRNERPTWFIRLWYAWGFLKGALVLLIRRPQA